MSVQGFLNDLDNQVVLGFKLSTLIYFGIVALISILLERIITRYLSRFARRVRLAPNVANNVILTFRLVILLVALLIVVRIGGVPTELIVTFSALGGAALGFASTKTIGNFIAGLYLLAAKPFRVGDYVRIGTVEGIVEEISINYTKIWTMGNNVVSINNLQIMDRDITNYVLEDERIGSLNCYTFEIGFDHSVSATKIAQIFNRTFDNYVGKLPRKPGYALIRSGAFERTYMVYLYVKNPNEVFALRPQIAEDLFKQWDAEKTRQ